MKTCLAIAGVFPPFGGAGAVRQVKLFRHLLAHGWRVDVIAPRGRAGWFRDEELARETRGLNVVRVGWPALPRPLESVRAAAKDPSFRGPGTGMVRRFSRAARRLRDVVAVPDEKLAWAAVALIRARALLAHRHYDLVFTSSLPYSCHLVGLGLRELGGPAWVAEHRDPWAGHSFRAQRSEWRRIVDERLEAAVTARADAVTVISPGMADRMTRRYGGSVAGKLHVIPNGYDAADFPPAGGSLAARDRFELLYVGTFDAGLTPPDVFLDALARVLRDSPESRGRVVFRILGGADLDASATLRQWMIDHDGGQIVRMGGFSGHACATRAMAGADALALCLAPAASWVLTSKVFEYLASHRPILAAVPPGDCRTLLEECGGAAIVDAGDAAALAGHLRRAIDQRALDVSARNREAVEEYDYVRIAGRAAELFSRVSGP